MTSEENGEQDLVADVFEKNLDLTSYEREVYLTLVENGKQEMAEIAETSGVPKHRVYDVIEKLKDKGYVEIINKYPKMAYAVPPEEVLEPVKNKIDQAEDELEQQYQTVDDIGGGIAMMKSRSTIERYLRKVFEASEIEAALTVPYEVLESHRELIKDGSSDIHLKLVISDIPDRHISGGEINLREPDTLGDEVFGLKSHEPVVMSADRSQSFFWTGSNPYRTNDEMQGFYITNPEFSLIFDRYITHSLIPRSNELYTESIPRESPATYIRIQDCIRDLEHRSGEELVIQVDGLSTTTRERVQFSGKLVDFHSKPDMVAYLEVVRDGLNGSQERVRVGGWKATTLDDYEGRYITIK